MKTTLTALQIEGNLLAPDMTAQMLEGSIKGQLPEDFGFNKTDKLADEIATAWGDAKAYWAAFQRALARLDENNSATTITRELWTVPLLQSLGYEPVYTATAEVVEDKTYAISHRAEAGENKPPIHIIGCRLEIDKRPPSGTPRLSAHALVQEYLNKTEHLWAIATNGYRWRLLRDSSLMTRLTYVEFDLEQILNGENFADFGLFYRLFHRSRLPEGVDDADKCLLEYYHQEAIQQGGRVREKLRDGVEKAIVQLGNGFIQHPQNERLRQKLGIIPNYEAEVTNYELYRQLLRLIYRLLFLMVAESRNLLLIGDDLEKSRIYREYYSIERLRELAERPHWRREGFQDLWQGLWVTFLLFDENWRGEVLGLSPLNGDLFGSGTLSALDNCAIDNYDLLIALRQLSLYQDKGQLRRVNYEYLDVEELGSVYESLLEFHPQVIFHQGIYEFALVFGSDRKTTGSYYTPPQLVQQLIKTALEPVIKEKLHSTQQKLGNSENNQELEKALLSLKVCDPACGSGHFLLAAARRIGKELAKVRTGEAEPGIEPLKLAIRDVIQNCIYGVDLNPLAVDLCKVALWIEGFPGRLPLSFLDHRIKCGNSLVGVLDINCLSEGIPDEAYKPVTGDDKKLSSQFKKRNKKERETDNQGQLSIFGGLQTERTHYTESARELGDIPESTPQQVREKQARYQQARKDLGWWRDYSTCNLWTAAFFMPLTEENLQLLPTTAVLTQLLQGTLSTQEIVNATNKLAEEKHFFHWPLEFPEVFEVDGFDCVLGNPPWERIKLQEKEFFASQSAEIANAINKAAREKLIKELPKKNPELAQAFEKAKHDAEAQSKFFRESSRFSLTAVGDINTYAVFAETTRKLISPDGRLGIIVPTGIATDDTTKKYFGDLIKSQSLASLTGFENEAFIFPSVHHSFKFCTLAVTGKNVKVKEADFTFFCRYFADTNNQVRHFNLSSEEIALINPNTLTCPIFRTSSDAEITKKIYRLLPVIENEKIGSNYWNISFMAMFHMANDSSLFKNDTGSNLLPLYEAKLFHQFDHLYSTYEGATQANLNAGILPHISEETKKNTNLTVSPRYWIKLTEVETKLNGKWNKSWLIGWRDITNSTSERTVIASLLPIAACGDTVLLMFPKIDNDKLVSCLLANLNCITFDFVARQKVAGIHLKFFTMRQLPVIPPEGYTQEDIEFISTRVLELVYTAWDMQPFAKDIGYDGEPFIWNPNRRALLRAELDAYYAKLYGLTRDELRYILDPADIYGADFPSETFRVLKNNEIKQFGEYRTQRLVLEAWDRMFDT
ncbi:Eco57I restriction-modification methylase domain-containing protein [Nostoc sp. 'Lobaria pulmonaria (5183) cyanobiont']|uniref:Eco57I restriction-modification methylase domain-containing protein n=1 Tax=Nostoc sp. 'Lobaria pulmonaria (5183) cyanobiont' TaxID=1618022 RepID=UPI000D0C010B|nr:DNA methyltransferase [Nostoc sp. 'Lobaria pulmonaria (5183) cyanobiont']AVH74344.1 type II restriction endonuclease/methyltransferase [Nostoc sp. 'Lobaria pulmonaria (5183) cyanobiont']